MVTKMVCKSSLTSPGARRVSQAIAGHQKNLLNQSGESSDKTDLHVWKSRSIMNYVISLLTF